MSCNIPYFKKLLDVVKDTWAKPIIAGEYENIEWFGYTSCDEKHPHPMVDMDEHMIYVDVPDDISHTYPKTYDAYQLIKDKVDFEYVVRTNTSLFVNIKNMYNRFNKIWCENENTVIGYFLDGWMLMGFFYGIKKELFECGLYERDIKDFTQGNIIENTDDVLISVNLENKLGDYHKTTITEDGLIPWYKPNLDKSECRETYEDPECCSFVPVDDDCIVYDSIVVRVRPPYDFDRTKTQEIEKIYELNNTLNRR